jgi:chromosome segregation ATPase
MIAQCNECNHLYKNKRTLKEHQRQSGHKNDNIEDNIAKLSDPAKLQTELSNKSILIAKFEDSIMAKDAEIASLEESLKNYENNITILDAQKAQLSSLEHEKDIVRNTLKNLTKKDYDIIGRQLGYIETPKPEPTADVKPVEPEPELFIGKKTDPGWVYYDVFGFSVKK